MMQYLLRSLLAFTLLLAVGNHPVVAQSTAAASSAPTRVDVGEPVGVVVGAGTVLDLPGEVDRIAVGDEKLATVTVLAKGQLLIHGNAIGSTTVFCWLNDGRLLRYRLVVQRDMDMIRFLLSELDDRIRIRESGDGQSLVLQGSAATARLAVEAEARVREILSASGVENPSVINLLEYPESTRIPDPDERLAESLKAIDPRITVRRIRVSEAEAEGAADSYVLGGRVRTIAQLTQAIMLADRQLGGTGGAIGAADESRIAFDRANNFSSFSGTSGANRGGGLEILRGTDPPPPGLAAQVARGLVLASESGRVISFLEVDELHQVLVSIRVMEINRDKARTLGINYRVDGKHFSLANFTSPLGEVFGEARAAPATVTGIGGANYVGAYVSSSVAVLTAIDALQRQAVARSVAEPNVMTLTGEQATVIVGGEVPIPTTSVGQVAAVQGFLFQSFGVRLDIRPTVDGQGIITMEVAPSIVRPDQGIGVGEVPGFQIESVQTIARVRGGESLVLGGLLNYEDIVSERKVPVLGNIPLIGEAFKWRNKAREERELLFVITPRIIDDLGVEGIEEHVDVPSSDFRNLRLGADVFPKPGLNADGRPSYWVDEQERVRVDAERRAMLDEAGRKPPRHRQLFPWSEVGKAKDEVTEPIPTEALGPELMAPVPRDFSIPPKVAPAPEVIEEPVQIDLPAVDEAPTPEPEEATRTAPPRRRLFPWSKSRALAEEPSASPPQDPPEPPVKKIEIDAEDILAPLGDEVALAPAPTRVYRVGPFRYALPSATEMNRFTDGMLARQEAPPAVVTLAPAP